jgi:tetratricopeptide (TPR) repeat protein
MEESPREPLARLASEVLEYVSPPFVLKDDLKRLDAVSRAGAPEAVILYSARILEALAGDALRKVGQPPSTNVFSNLQVLEHLNRVSTASLYWAHALRRLGNAVRHIDSRVGPDEAVVSTAFAEGWLDWFFCRFSHGHRLPGLTRDQKPVGLCGAEELRIVMRSLEEIGSGGPNVEEIEGKRTFRNTPVLAGVLADILLSRKEHEDAFRVLQAGLLQFPDDLRLRQLMGLYWSHEEKLDKALEWLEPLYAQFPDDDETAGITAGVYKRLWQANRSNVADLDKSHRAYRGAWKKSGRKNAWLGINAATTALWLDRREEYRRLAQEVADLLQGRAVSLPADLRAPRLAFNYWDQVTLAEAQLLLGDWPTAQQTYQDAFNRHADRRGDIEVTRKQRDEIIKALGLPMVRSASRVEPKSPYEGPLPADVQAGDSDGDPLTYAVSDTPPTGTSIDANTGRITWTPTATGTFNGFSVIAIDSFNVSSTAQPISVTVSAHTTPPTVELQSELRPVYDARNRLGEDDQITTQQGWDMPTYLGTDLKWDLGRDAKLVSYGYDASGMLDDEQITTQQGEDMLYHVEGDLGGDRLDVPETDTLSCYVKGDLGDDHLEASLPTEEENGQLGVLQEEFQRARGTGQSPELRSVDDNVQFTVYRPRVVMPDQWYTLLAFAHLATKPSDAPANEPDPVEEVKRQAMRVLGDRENRAYQVVTQDAPQPVPRQETLTFVPEIRGVEFNPPFRNFQWTESVHREEFRLRAGPDLVGQTARGRLSVFLGDILLADVSLAIAVVQPAWLQYDEAPTEADHARRYRKIFASYSHKDLHVVEQIESLARAIGDEYLRDWKHLRAGEVWDERLLKMIDEADVFQLFWSRQAMDSPYIHREYEYALALNRPNFVRPTYWEEPLPSDPARHLPPERLLRLHFQRIGPLLLSPLERPSSATASKQADDLRPASETIFNRLLRYAQLVSVWVVALIVGLAAILWLSLH